MTETSIPVSYFNLKANVASSESCNNVCLADEYNRWNPYVCDPKRLDGRVRDTVEGHPCAVFFTSTAEAAIEVGARMVQPGETILCFVGDMNNSKENFAVFGQDNGKYPRQCCVEIMNNTELPCRFREEIGDDETWKDGNFEFRFPEEPTEEMKAAFTEVQRWVVSTDRDGATGAALELKALEKFVMDTSNLALIRVEDCPGIDTLSICKGAQGLERGRLTGVDWVDGDASTLMHLAGLKGYDGQGKPVDGFVLTGRAHVQIITQLQIDTIRSAFPELELSYEEIVESVTVTFRNWDGTVLNTQIMPVGSDAVNPLSAGMIEEPQRESDVEKHYRYSGWDRGFANVQEDTVVTAVFTGTDRFYRVTHWIDEAESAVCQEDTIIAHGSVDCRTEPVKEGAVFIGWDTDTTDVVCDLDVHPVFIVPKLPDSVPEKFDYLYSDDPDDDSALSLEEFMGVLRHGAGKTYFQVGDRVKMVIPENDIFTDRQIELMVLGFNHYRLTDGSGGFAGWYSEWLE